MKNIKEMILLSIIGFSLIGSFVSPVSANAIKPIEATISRDRGVCGDMNKNSTTYKRYCLKDGNASAHLTQRQIDCIWSLFGVAVSPAGGWVSVIRELGNVAYKCYNV